MARPMSADTARLCTESGRLVANVDLHDWSSQERLLTSREYSGGHRVPVTERINVIGGSITTDQSRDIPGTGSLEVILDPATAAQVLPVKSTSPLSPVSGTYAQISFGPEGEECWYGRYDVTSVTPEEQGQGVVMGIDLADNARRVERAKFFRPRTIAKYTVYPDVFLNLLSQVLPKSKFTIYPWGRKCALHTYNVGDSRLAAVTEFKDAVGAFIDWNEGGRGHVSIQPWPDDEVDSVWVLSESAELGLTKNGTLTGVTRELSDERAFNGVICSGEAAGSDKPPVRAEVWDSRPGPFYFDPDRPYASAYGPVPDFMTSGVVTTTQQARAAAAKRLARVSGMTERLAFTGVRHPGVEPGDAAYVKRERIGADGVFIVESVTMPLLAAGGLMSVTCRERRVFE